MLNFCVWISGLIRFECCPFESLLCALCSLVAFGFNQQEHFCSLFTDHLAFNFYSEDHQFGSIVRCQSYQALRLVAVDSLPSKRKKQNRLFIYYSIVEVLTVLDCILFPVQPNRMHGFQLHGLAAPSASTRIWPPIEHAWWGSVWHATSWQPIQQLFK